MVRRIVAASGREPRVVRGHVVAVLSVRAVVVPVSSGILVVSAGVVTTVVGSTAVVVIVVVIEVVIVVVVGRRVVGRRVVVGAVNNRSHIWYQVEMEEEGNNTNISGIHPFLSVSTALTGLDHCNAREIWVS